MLRSSLKSQVFGALRAVKLYEWCSISSTEAGMLSNAELVEFPYDLVKVLTERAENYRELSLLFFVENTSPEERRNQMKLAFTKHVHHKLLFLSVDYISIFISCIILIERFSSLNFQGEV